MLRNYKESIYLFLCQKICRTRYLLYNSCFTTFLVPRPKHPFPFNKNCRFAQRSKKVPTHFFVKIKHRNYKHHYFPQYHMYLCQLKYCQKANSWLPLLNLATLCYTWLPIVHPFIRSQLELATLVLVAKAYFSCKRESRHFMLRVKIVS